MWKKAGNLELSNISEYTTKQGYKLRLLNRRATMPLDVHFAKKGFTPKQKEIPLC